MLINLRLEPVVVVEPPTGQDSVPHQSRSKAVQGRGQGPTLLDDGVSCCTYSETYLTRPLPAEHLHLGHHVVVPGAGVEELAPDDHQDILTSKNDSLALIWL